MAQSSTRCSARKLRQQARGGLASLPPLPPPAGGPEAELRRVCTQFGVSHVELVDRGRIAAPIGACISAPRFGCRWQNGGFDGFEILVLQRAPDAGLEVYARLTKGFNQLLDQLRDYLCKLVG